MQAIPPWQHSPIFVTLSPAEAMQPQTGYVILILMCRRGNRSLVVHFVLHFDRVLCGARDEVGVAMKEVPVQNCVSGLVFSDPVSFCS